MAPNTTSKDGRNATMAPSITSNDCFYRSYDLQKPRVFHVLDDNRNFISEEHGIRCLDEGTDCILWERSNYLEHDARYNVSSSRPNKVSTCVCRPGWYGLHCSFPRILQHSRARFMKQLTMRTAARRIVYSFPFNMEFNWMETIFAELGDIIDVFLIIESNFTNYGDSKKLELLENLRKCQFHEFQNKIVYVHLNYFPSDGRKYGNKADNLPRRLLGEIGVRENLKGLRSDDLYFIFDADEIPTRDALLFLKIHDGYFEPIGFNLHHRIFGFFWQNRQAPSTEIMAGCSIEMLVKLFQYRSDYLRWSLSHKHSNRWTAHSSDVREYMNATGKTVGPWKLGTSNHFSGYHCSWCFTADRIKQKLTSAQSGDPPRWGDYEENTNISYINCLIENGMWFDGKRKFTKVAGVQELPPPLYMSKHADRFGYLLVNPFINLNISKINIR